MRKNEIIENGWKMDDQEEMRQAAACMTYDEYKAYKEQQKKQADRKSVV